MEKLTPEQTQEIENLMETWGAWAYSGRLERRQTSIIAEYMAKVKPQKYQNRPMCDDETGLVIDEIMLEIKKESEPAFELLTQYYVFLMPRYQIAIRYHRKTRLKDDSPSLGTYRNLVEKILNNYRFYIYNRYNSLIKESKKTKK